METKSRYEVIAELERQKRDLITQRNSFNDEILGKENRIKQIERQKMDNIMLLDRQLEDLKSDLESYKKSLDERKETLNTLIKSVDDSLARFNSMNK